MFSIIEKAINESKLGLGGFDDLHLNHQVHLYA
jgi:hypothetical protein